MGCEKKGKIDLGIAAFTVLQEFNSDVMAVYFRLGILTWQQMTSAYFVLDPNQLIYRDITSNQVREGFTPTCMLT